MNRLSRHISVTNWVTTTMLLNSPIKQMKNVKFLKHHCRFIQMQLSMKFKIVFFNVPPPSTKLEGSFMITICCIFWPANGSSPCCLLVEIINMRAQCMDNHDLSTELYSPLASTHNTMVFSHEHTQTIWCMRCLPSPTRKHFYMPLPRFKPRTPTTIRT